MMSAKMLLPLGRGTGAPKGRAVTRRIYSTPRSPRNLEVWWIAFFGGKERRHEDQTPSGSDLGEAAGREGGQEGRHHHPRYGQGEAARGRGGRGGAGQGGGRRQAHPHGGQEGGQDPLRQVLRQRGEAGRPGGPDHAGGGRAGHPPLSLRDRRPVVRGRDALAQGDGTQRRALKREGRGKGSEATSRR